MSCASSGGQQIRVPSPSLEKESQHIITFENAPDGERTRRDTPTTVAQFTEENFKINIQSKGSVGGRYVIIDQEHLRLDFHYSDGTTEPTPVAIAITTRQLTMYWNSLSGNGTKIVEVYSRFQ